MQSYSGVMNDPIWKYHKMDVSAFFKELRKAVRKGCAALRGNSLLSRPPQAVHCFDRAAQRRKQFVANQWSFSHLIW